MTEDTSEDTSSRPPVQEQQSLPPISDNEDDDDWYTPGDSDLSCCSSEKEDEIDNRPGKRRRLQYGWELPYSQLQDIDDDDGTELELWKRMFKQLVKYKSEHGHASPSLNDSKNKELAIWTYEQRIICNEGMLDKTRRKCLLLIGFILKSKANGTPNPYGDKREAVSVYCAKTGMLLENCVSINSASPNLWETVGNGILKDWNKDNRVRHASACVSAEDIKAAGPNGLDVGNRGTLEEPERIFTLKMSTGKEKITLSDKKRQKILNDGKNDHEKSGRRRSANRATSSLYVISKADKDGNILPPFAKARNIKDAVYHKEDNHGGIRIRIGRSSTYVCGPETEHDPEGHEPQLCSGKKLILVNDAAILKEMKWQKKNSLPVVGFRDDAYFKDGGRGKVSKPHPERVRYIVILEEDAEGRSPQLQYDSMVGVLDMTDQKKNKKEAAGKKRKAETKTDKKDGTKKRKASRKGVGFKMKLP